MGRIIDWVAIALSVAVLLALTACQSLIEGLGAAACDPAVQHHAAGAVTQAFRGDWFGATEQLFQMGFSGYVAYKATMLRRDRARRARNEPVAP